MIGKSGSKVEVLDACAYKFDGTDNLYAQAELCELLGPEVAPLILQKFQVANSYYMEKLHHLKNKDPASLIKEAVRLLATHVWPRGSSYAEEFPNWREAVDAFTDGKLPCIDALYDEPEFCLIHGDCTFANMMRRKDGSLVLIDPVPPRANAPSLIEMDIARLVQSIYNWEHYIAPDLWPLIGPAESILLEDTLLDVVGYSRQPRVLYWCAYNCLRILHKSVDPDSCGWAKEHFELFREKLHGSLGI